ncbi:Mycoplasma protein of unknown function, DUF285 [Seminavis robusta]|uniref:Uncharacterized protein n=1 Tax=Seminavis robusta TaxID=568900 RepID=A0A9N8H967_9STRA|nr:Mycoplasma protein of unknown function, DUF285 [Seminavis robusta]|eukprot:Sro195_g083120.1 Mycoplasma protein of unknown function, DUF285 (542) ;mRNA; f:24384-26009
MADTPNKSTTSSPNPALEADQELEMPPVDHELEKPPTDDVAVVSDDATGSSTGTLEDLSKADLVSSIQPLPSAPPQEDEEAPGAHAIAGIAPFSRVVVVPPNNDRPEEETLDNGSEDEGLVQAELVTTDVVHAHKVEEEPPTQERSRIVVVVAAALILIIVVLAVVVIALVSGGRSSSNSNRQPQQETNSTDDHDCFQTSTELFEAINQYYQDDTPASSVAQTYGWPIGQWCVSPLWDFSYMFAADRTRDILVTTLPEQVQTAAENFHEDISSWDMGANARHLDEMMRGVQNLSNSWGIAQWDVSQVTSMTCMLADTTWNQPQLNLSSWDTSNVHTMSCLLENSNVEAAGLAQWDTSNVTNLWRFAEGTTHFNEDLSQWNTGSVTQLRRAFRGALAFDQNLSQWDTSMVTGLSSAFRFAAIFNGDVTTWDVSRVDSLLGTFRGARMFNQDIGAWNVSQVRDMRNAFEGSAFNQDVSSWDVSSTTALVGAFRNAQNFSQNLCSWGQKLPFNATTHIMFEGTACPNTSAPVIPHGPFCYNCVD